MRWPAPVSCRQADNPHYSLNPDFHTSLHCLCQFTYLECPPFSFSLRKPFAYLKAPLQSIF